MMKIFYIGVLTIWTNLIMAGVAFISGGEISFSGDLKKFNNQSLPGYSLLESSLAADPSTDRLFFDARDLSSGERIIFSLAMTTGEISEMVAGFNPVVYKGGEKIIFLIYENGEYRIMQLDLESGTFSALSADVFSRQPSIISCGKFLIVGAKGLGSFKRYMIDENGTKISGLEKLPQNYDLIDCISGQGLLVAFDNLKKTALLYDLNSNEAHPVKGMEQGEYPLSTVNQGRGIIVLRRKIESKLIFFKEEVYAVGSMDLESGEFDVFSEKLLQPRQVVGW